MTDQRLENADETTVGPADRRSWMAVLACADTAALEAGLARLGPLPGYAFLRRPETGAILVQGRIGGTGAPFHLGEMTVTRCTVRLAPSDTADTGVPAAPTDPAVGTAYIAGRSHRHAELAALLDALMQHPAWNATVRAAVLAPLTAAQAAARAGRTARAAATKVDFFTLAREA